jgi:NADH-quinone oxidoreductase subunit A
MSAHAYSPAKTFTIEQANAMLPLVRAITADLTALAREVVERRHRLEVVLAGRDLKAGDPYAEELAHVEAELNRDAIRLKGYLEELRELGVEPKGAIDGLVDFPSLMDGRLVYLCWKLGEVEITHWHELEAGYAGRLSPAYYSSLAIVAYMALFAAIGVVFLFANLLVGKLLRPFNPHAEKLEIYECGEPTIGSSFVQFDLRFYVVALLFIIFDVEVAFFFPWAAVFGKSTNMMAEDFAVVRRDPQTQQLVLTDDARHLYQELGVRNPTVPTTTPPSLTEVVTSSDELEAASQRIHRGAAQLAWITIVDIGAFFVVLLIGFAYVWKRGDLDWVRAVSHEQAARPPRGGTGDPLAEEQFLSV